MTQIIQIKYLEKKAPGLLELVQKLVPPGNFIESDTYSLQVEAMYPPPMKVDTDTFSHRKVIMINMQLRYENVAEFLKKHGVHLYEIHIKESLMDQFVEYEYLQRYQYTSNEEVLEKISEILSA